MTLKAARRRDTPGDDWQFKSWCQYCGFPIFRKAPKDPWYKETATTQMTSFCNRAPDKGTFDMRLHVPTPGQILKLPTTS